MIVPFPPLPLCVYIVITHYRDYELTIHYLQAWIRVAGFVRLYSHVPYIHDYYEDILPDRNDVARSGAGPSRIRVLKLAVFYILN